MRRVFFLKVETKRGRLPQASRTPCHCPHSSQPVCVCDCDCVTVSVSVVRPGCPAQRVWGACSLCVRVPPQANGGGTDVGHSGCMLRCRKVGTGTQGAVSPGCLGCVYTAQTAGHTDASPPHGSTLRLAAPTPTVSCIGVEQPWCSPPAMMCAHVRVCAGDAGVRPWPRGHGHGGHALHDRCNGPAPKPVGHPRIGWTIPNPGICSTQPGGWGWRSSQRAPSSALRPWSRVAAH